MSVLTATGAGVRHRRRWLVRDLDLRIEAGETVAVVGPPGSGRTTALLALARRLRLTTGRIDLSGTAALAHVPDVEEPEPVFTVLEHVRERLALLGRPRRAAASIPLYGLDPDLRGRDLSPYQRHLLGLTLAMLNEPAVIALDGVDAGLDRAEQDALWTLLAEITAGGVAVLVTAREIDPARVDRVVSLGDPRSGAPGRPTIEAPARDLVPAVEPAVEEVDPPVDDIVPAEEEVDPPAGDPVPAEEPEKEPAEPEGEPRVGEEDRRPGRDARQETGDEEDAR
ncbi:ABC transporter ATP-binding protein [Actinoplanes sp. NEAU-A12]|uniref:ABC transporter ATP-binding protein n=1 Tax=Actinoplanes sandaracinus TaxID=3045177 RepID=A0ABT6WCY4_9ACTN|nr:ABC transporter ATP-binding protein [Actinoplanes sandaracinus]MDI6097596.1 ABC transporter ATP-binding protein [Actinoplanes sandaracinus]